MDIITTFFSEELTYALGWTVIHSLWQGLAIALVLCTILYHCDARKSNIRYHYSLASLFLMFGISISTFCYYYLHAEIQTTANLHTVFPTTTFNHTESVITPAIANISPMAHFGSLISENLTFIVLIWFMGMLLISARFIYSAFSIYKIKNSFTSIASVHIMEEFQQLKAKLGLQNNIQLGTSEHVHSPLVIGYFVPVILFPVAMINQLSTQEVQAIIAHELAHIYRNDFLINIIQICIESLFYFHPAVWYISNQIRKERENCCDDIAIQITGKKLAYAKALLSVQEKNMDHHILTLGFSNNKLLSRIQRIFNQNPKTNFMERIVSILLLLAFIVSFGVACIGPEKSHLFSEDQISLEECLNNEPQKYAKEDSSSFEAHMNVKDVHVEMVAEDGVVKNLKVGKHTIPESHFQQVPEIIHAVYSTMQSSVPDLEPSLVDRIQTIATQPAYKKPSLYFPMKNTNRKDSLREVYKIQENGKKYHIVLENDEIKELKIDNKRIAESEFKNYAAEVWKNIALVNKGGPPPPAPPMPPAPPAHQMPAAPPMPPAPPVPGKTNKGNKSISIQKYKLSDDGKDTIKVYSNDQDFMGFQINIDGHNYDEIALMEKLKELELLDIVSELDMDIFLKDAKEKLSHNFSTSRAELNDKIAELKSYFDENKDIKIQLFSEGTKEIDMLGNMFEERLLEDNLIDDPDKYSYKLTSKYFKINGQKYTGPIFEKYKAMFEEHGRLGKRSSFQISKNGKNKSRSNKSIF